ncbi:MAG: hypothetical protein EKK61_04150 [Rickettsiales bacterium]|nr:MAG: hypothetical protein EKK61_04150 [Rickettsiales bacterium]
MIKYTAKNYKQFDLSSFHHKDTIVYLDPPYEGAAEYKK